MIPQWMTSNEKQITASLVKVSPRKIGDSYYWVVDDFIDECFHDGREIEVTTQAPTREGLAFFPCLSCFQPAASDELKAMVCPDCWDRGDRHCKICDHDWNVNEDESFPCPECGWEAEIKDGQDNQNG